MICDDGSEESTFCSSPGPGLHRGSLVDLDLRRGDAEHGSGQGRDQFTEIFDSVSLDLMATESVVVLADGSDGGPAIVRSQGPAGSYISYISILGGLLGVPRTWQVTDYILKPGDPYLTIRTHAVVWDQDTAPPDPCGWQPGDEGLPCDAFVVPDATGTIPLLDTLQEGQLAFGDFFFAGADVDFFAAGMGFDEDQFVFDTMESGRNSILDPFPFPFLGAAGDRVSYAVGSKGLISSPIFTSGLTAVFGAAADPPSVDGEGNPVWLEGDAATWERFVGVGVGDVGSAVEAVWQAQRDHGVSVPLGEIRGRVLEDATLDALSGVHVFVFSDTGAALDGDGVPPLDDLFLHWETDTGDDTMPDGSFGGALPPGDWLLVTKEAGRAPSPAVPVTVAEDATVELTLLAPRPSRLDLEVRDERGRAMPAKVSLLPADATTRAYRSELGDPFVPGGYAFVEHVRGGPVQLDVPPGTYHVMVSRGLEYGLWDSRDHGHPNGVRLAAGQPVALEAVVAREVDTSGWIAADFHVHGANSHDSGLTLERRALAMAAEGVEFFMASDHDVHTDYRPVIDEEGLNPWVQSTVGVETTTIELGHWLGFPLAVDYDAINHGALDWTGKPAAEIVAGLRERGAHGPEETFVFNAHPRDGVFGYFDQYGLDPFAGSRLSPVIEEGSLLALANPILSDPSTFVLDYDGLEVLNAKRYDLVRTPTEQELRCYAQPRLPACADVPPTTMYSMIERTLEEQARLEDLDQPFTLSTDLQGQVDDWFTLLNLGFRLTAIGNSDTHGLWSLEGGCPRNYIVSSTDDPELIDEVEVARAMREHRVVTTYGPWMNMYVDRPENGLGTQVSVDGSAEVHVEVQAPRWMQIDRVELYENARLVHVWKGEDLDSDSVLRLSASWSAAPVDEDGDPIDAWYVAMAMGDGDLSPVLTPIDRPPLELTDVVTGALGGIDLGVIDLAAAVGEPVPFPDTGPMFPYAVTNPIWVDFNGEDAFGNTFLPLGEVPAWFRPTPEE